jgi:RNA polymerase sigma factor (sigma-70 family)
MRTAALEMLDRLPASEAAIIRKRFIDNRSTREVAADLGLGRMTVARREKAALTKLREALEP